MGTVLLRWGLQRGHCCGTGPGGSASPPSALWRPLRDGSRGGERLQRRAVAGRGGPWLERRQWSPRAPCWRGAVPAILWRRRCGSTDPSPWVRHLPGLIASGLVVLESTAPPGTSEARGTSAVRRSCTSGTSRPTAGVWFRAPSGTHRTGTVHARVSTLDPSRRCGNHGIPGRFSPADTTETQSPGPCGRLAHGPYGDHLRRRRHGALQRLLRVRHAGRAA